jgi:hypothetical protein
VDPTKEHWWRAGLELHMRRSSGDAFQDFFGRIMEARHGADYVRVRAFGRRGDKGCDGYLASSGVVYQCYGAVNGDGGKVDYLIGKMEEDFAKARTLLKDVMKEWRMAHNLVDGLPAEAIQTLEAIKKANPEIPCSFVAKESLTKTLLSLDEAVIATLVGPAATSIDEQNMQTTELRDLVVAVLAAVDETPLSTGDIKVVSAEKLAYNALPTHWSHIISAGWQNAHHVSSYFARHPDPMTGERVAQRFRDRYAYLKAQNLTAADIMTDLYGSIVGVGVASVPRMIAAQALLAHLFESCDILEDAPQRAPL